MEKLEFENQEELQREMDRIEAFVKMKDAKWRDRFGEKTATIYVEMDTTIRNWTFAVPMNIDVGFGRSAGYVARDLGPADKTSARLKYEVVQVRAFRGYAPGMRPSMRREFSLAGETILVKHFEDGRIFWSSHWELVNEMMEAGLVRRVAGGPGTMGHRDFFVLDGIGIPK